jgi:ABC-2 type transport system ATP-binding protein
MIQIDNVTKSFQTTLTKRVTAVKNLSLDVKKGQVYGFLGPNGSGKTTTLKLILGLVKKDSGSIKLMGRDPRDHRSRKDIGYLPENPYFYSHLTGGELLDFAGELHGMPRSLIKQRKELLLSMVSLTGKENIKMKGYSKGMLQRIGLAQALINDPELVLLDEPMSGLDPIGRYEVREIIENLKKEGKTIFFCSHILSDVENICTNLSIIVDSNKVFEGTMDDVRKQDTTLEEFFIKTVKKVRS